MRQFHRELYWHRQLEKTQHLLYKDDLTGLFNYRYLHVALQNESVRYQRFAQGFSLLFLDLDNFKIINDQFGHGQGSSVLKDVALLLKDSVREVDIVVRYGGDEFVIILIGTNSLHASFAAERLREIIAQTPFYITKHSHPVYLTASIGIASCPEHTTDKNELLRLADERMYHGKRQGKNRVVHAAHEGLSEIVFGGTPREATQMLP